MNNLLLLPPELKECIFNYLEKDKSDLLNVACCSKQLNEEMKYFIYSNVKIRFRDLEKLHSWKCFKDTKTLRLNEDSLDSSSWLEFRENYLKLINNCEPENLTNFEVFHSVMWMDDIKSTLFRFNKLQKLCLKNCTYITKTILNAICVDYSNNLTKLDIAYNEYRLVGGFDNFHRLTNLVYLNVRETVISNDILKEICLTIPLLKRLLLETSNISDEGLSNMIHLKNLVELDISNNSAVPYSNKITDDGLSHLQNNDTLRNLQVCVNEYMSDVGTKYISSLRNLTYLDLSFTEITDLSLLYISQSLTKLQTLELESCWDITNTGIRHISTLPVLKSLIIDNCKLVTKEGLDCLQPNIDVSFTKEEDSDDYCDDEQSDDDEEEISEDDSDNDNEDD